MNWLVYRITGSPLLLGTVDFMTQILVLFFGSFTGLSGEAGTFAGSS